MLDRLVAIGFVIGMQLECDIRAQYEGKSMIIEHKSTVEEELRYESITCTIKMLSHHFLIPLNFA